MARLPAARIPSPRSQSFWLLLQPEFPIPARGGTLLQPCKSPFLGRTQILDTAVAGLDGMLPGQRVRRNPSFISEEAKQMRIHPATRIPSIGDASRTVNSLTILQVPLRRLQIGMPVRMKKRR